MALSLTFIMVTCQNLILSKLIWLMVMVIHPALVLCQLVLCLFRITILIGF